MAWWSCVHYGEEGCAEQFGMQGNGVHLRPTPWPSFSGNTVELYLHKPLTESIRSPWMPPENVAMLHHPQHHDSDTGCSKDMAATPQNCNTIPYNETLGHVDDNLSTTMATPWF